MIPDILDRLLVGEIVYDGKLSLEAYLVLVGVSLLIIGGFSWCFYRALHATNQDALEQHPDEI